MYRKMEEEIEQLSAQVAEQAEQRSGARLLLTHPGVGPVTALATDVFLGDPQRFADGNALASYVGLIPREYSSGARQRLDALTKQGSPLLRFLWNEAGPLPEADLSVFAGKIEKKSTFTRGVFVALNGVSGEAREAITQGKAPSFFVMDGHDLIAILTGTISLPEFLRRRVRLLAEEGRVCVPFPELR
jgi:Transposase IS116/IS110/IS902 family